MNNRMCGFTLQPGHPNEIAPDKRPVHTLHSYIVTLDPPPLLPLQEKTGMQREPSTIVAIGGTPGAMQQPQTNLQVLDHVLRLGMDTQDALDAPRWSLNYVDAGPLEERTVAVEVREPNNLAREFGNAGFVVRDLPAWEPRMGRAYLAVTGPSGLHVAADPRGEGEAIAF
jgi:gamma-glutamyltranspeptidase/glutathione hydrolase